jgi:hypothetical protein|tara:strand:+ start:115 stop:2259 length:2145 start_codon:yes stop_codon:yes gene_type:complete
MSLAQGFNAFMKGSIAADNLREGRRARDMQEQQVNLSEEQAQRTRSLDDVYAVANLATDLGVSSDAGLRIDKAKLTALWEAQAASGKIDPRLQQLAALLGNDDSAAKNNPGFSFTGVTLDGDTIALQGGYDGEETTKFSTVDRKPGDDAEVAFASYGDASKLMANQYNQMWNRPGVSGYKREYQMKNGLNKNNDQIRDNEALIYDAVGQLTNELEDAINKIAGNEKGAAITTKLKRALAGKPYTEQLKILQQYGSELQLPASKAITPDVEKAAAEADAAGEETTTTAEVKVAGGEATTDNSAKIAELEARMAKVPPGRAGVARKKELQNQIEQLKSEAPTATTTNDNSAEIARLEEEIASIPSGEGRGGEVRREALQGQVDQLKGASPAPVAPTEEAAPVDENPAIQSGVEKAKAATDEDIVEGKVQFTQEEIVALQERLKAKGIETLEDMNKATREEQQELRAMLSTIAVNKEQREEYLKRMNNVMSTGSTDYNSKEMQEAQIAQRQVAVNESTARTGRQNAATSQANSQRLITEMNGTFRGNQGTFIGKKVDKISSLFTDKKTGEALDPSVDEYKKAAFGVGGAISSIWGKTKEQLRILKSGASAMEKKTAQQQLNMLEQALLAQISFGMQFVSAKGDLEWSMATDSGASLSGNDSALSRIARDGDGFMIRKPGSGTQDGDAFTGEQLAELFGDKDLFYFFDQKLTAIEGKR